ncbi:hypothetical protein Pelo_16942 [Pelomyxa schiedti]|nr:hypothetical protein Pelo_16942 [Pelomyxa schiedti]
MTLEAGRVRPDDQVTMSLVHEACPVIQGNYSIIVNKIPLITHSRILNNPSDREMLVGAILSGHPVTKHIGFFPKVASLDDANDAYYEPTQEIKDFVLDAPIVEIVPSDVHRLAEDKWEAQLAKFEAMTKELTENNAKMSKALEVQSMEYTQRLAAMTAMQNQLQGQNSRSIQKLIDAVKAIPPPPPASNGDCTLL